ncbi:thioesterase II family protein [Mycobacterium sp. 155]|uniref:thioesterase II family protein n=1 Tax=Mycobacterium sp. 155 TaxID=1157943 RepID=UPI00039ABFAA|nr:alpha/beta fold hydrolase [Mycobacterium sp. 155]
MQDANELSTVTTETKVEPRLYIFPHTGGSPDFYVPFARAFTGTKCVAVQYPGKRAGKDLSRYTSIPELADRLCAMLKPAEAPAGQVALFGHSMGALLAFEVALRFEQAGNPIAALFVSASAAPGVTRYGVDLQGSDLELLNMVSEVTGANPEFLKNDQFAATMLPTLRGLKAIASYNCPPEVKLSSPIYGLMADDDELATTELMTPWAQRTTSDFDLTTFPGDHFYINTNLPGLAHWVEERVFAPGTAVRAANRRV